MRVLKDWLMSYLEYTQEQEAPEIFHFWSGVAALASTIGRNVWVDRGFYTLYPNHYIVILAGSGVARKSVAVGITKNILMKAGTSYISDDRITNAGLIEDLASRSKEVGKAEVLIWADELKSFLSKEETHRGILTTLTTLYGCPNIYQNKLIMRGREVILFPCINTLMATTPTDLVELIPDTATGAGFTPRLHIVYQKTRRHKKADPTYSRELEDMLVVDLKHIKTICGQMKMSPESNKWWLNYYDKLPDEAPSEELDGFYARKGDYMLKLATVISLARKDELILGIEEMKIADGFLTALEGKLKLVYKKFGQTPSTAHFDRVLGQIRKRGGMATKSDLLHDNWARLNATELEAVMRSLEEAMLVDSDIKGRTTTYKEMGRKPNGK